jgi:hypothetical protein
MLYEFLRTNRADLIARCQVKAAERKHPGGSAGTGDNGIPQFLAQLIETFDAEQTPEARTRHKVGAPSLALVPAVFGDTAAKHGRELREHGLTIDQVVHDYGDLCQAMTELALEKNAPISVDEFHTFNRCLDDAIADAVSAYSGYGISPLPEAGAATAQELRVLIDTAVHTFAAMKRGDVAMQGATSTLHERCLIGLRNVIDRAFPADVEPAARVGLPL